MHGTLTSLYRTPKDGFSLYTYVKANKGKCAFLLATCLFVTLSIALSNTPYLDDIRRQMTGEANFGKHASRYGSDYIAYMINGGSYLPDLGNFSYLLSGVLMTLTVIITSASLSRHRHMHWATCFSGIVMVINPWFLNCLVFRFDNPYMSLSLLASVLPFIYYGQRKFYPISICSLFVMFNTYQASSGIYLVVLIAKVLLEMQGKQAVQEIIKKVTGGLLSFAIASIAYLVEVKLLPGDFVRNGLHTTLPPLSRLIPTAIQNYQAYWTTIVADSKRSWVLLSAFVLLVFVVTFKSSKHRLAAITINSLAVFAMLLASYGIYAVNAESLIESQLRYGYGLAYAIGIMAILAAQTFIRKADQYVLAGPVALLAFFMVSFSATYAYTAYANEQYFQIQATILTANLNQDIPEKEATIYSSYLLNDSQVYQSSLKKYPVMSRLAISNTIFIWTNQDKIKALTGFAWDFVGQSEVDTSQLELVNETAMYRLYHYKEGYYLDRK